MSKVAILMSKQK